MDYSEALAEDFLRRSERTRREASALRCSWPGCWNGKWLERGIEVCGGHAKAVLDAMAPEVSQRAQRTVDERVRRLQAVVDDQHRTIHQLRGEQPETKSPPAKPAVVNGVVYYLRSGGYIKIGWASNLQKRMKAYPPDTMLLATEPGTRADEQRRHRTFAVHRTHGREWYAMVPPLMEHIDKVKRENGEPDAVVFAAKPVTVPRPHSNKTRPKSVPFIQRVS